MHPAATRLVAHKLPDRHAVKADCMTPHGAMVTRRELQTLAGHVISTLIAGEGSWTEHVEAYGRSPSNAQHKNTTAQEATTGAASLAASSAPA